MKSQSKYFLGLWILNPFLSAIFLFKKFGSIKSVWPFLFISFFFGLSFVVSPKLGADSVRYAENLNFYYKNQISLVSILNSLYHEEGTLLDVYQPILTWLVSRFTANYKILFSIFAVVFGYFWFKTLLILRNLLPYKLSAFILIPFIFVALSNPIWNISGVRMWTAVQIFIYGVTRIYCFNDKKGAIFLVAPILVHFSLIIAFLVFLFFFVLPKRNLNLFIALYFLTFFIREIDLEIVSNLFKNLPGFLESKKSYLNEDYKQLILKKADQNALHIQLYNFLKKMIAPFTVLWFFFQNKRILSLNWNFDKFLKFGLFFASFANLASSVPSGGRFLVISNMIVVFIFMITLQKSLIFTFSKIFLVFISMAMIYCIVVDIRKMLDFVGVLFFLGNPLISFLSIDEIPIMEFLKNSFQ